MPCTHPSLPQANCKPRIPPMTRMCKWLVLLIRVIRVIRGCLFQGLRRRLSQGPIELKLGSVVVDDRIQVSKTAQSEEPKALQYLDDQPYPILGPSEILLEGVRTGLDSPLVRGDLREPCLSTGVGCGNL